MGDLAKMSGTEDIPAPAAHVGGEEDTAAETDAAGDNGMVLSSKSSDISIEEIGPEDNGAGSTDDNAEVLIADVSAEVSAEVAAAPAPAAVAEVEASATVEEIKP